ncbi:glycoside hydrolase family 95-like protein [Mucilaginibacter terrae]|uniref:glycoside hydrolase family 95-like protein n=1 Tax=Mucilaginibacter terrae TaxID=1955052 RepID=UPI003642BF89
MLLQSHDGAIYLLPALPDAWADGSIAGLVARGGFKVNMVWRNHRIQKLTIFSALGGKCRLRTNQQLSSVILKKATGNNSNSYYRVENITTPVINVPATNLALNMPANWLYDLETKPGKTYIFEVK